MHTEPVTGLSDLYFPESDGEPMAETDLHRKEIIDLLVALESFFRQNSDIYVSGNLLLYFDPKDPDKRVAPDVFVIKGVPNKPRRIYKLWEEKNAPSVVIEVSSRKTIRDDQGRKMEIYRDILKVPEYFLFDPAKEYLSTPLIGYRLGKRGYRKISGRIYSQELELDLRVVKGHLRFYDPAQQKFLPVPEEEAEIRQKLEAEWKRSEEARQTAEERWQRAEEERAKEAQTRQKMELEIKKLHQALKRLEEEKT